MHYVNGFRINGIDTAQVACIELKGKPNAATEAAVGALGIDTTSPLHEVYKCVAVNGSIYTWELFSSGLSIVSSTVTGAGEPLTEFSYDKLRTPEGYAVKAGDLILDKEGYLYQIKSLHALACVAEYCGTQIVSGMPKVGTVDNGKILQVVDGCHSFVGVNESSVGDYIRTGAVKTITTIDGRKLRFFVGTHDQYAKLSDDDKQGLHAILGDDATKTGLLLDIDDIERRLNECLGKPTKFDGGDIALLPIPFLEYDEESGASNVKTIDEFNFEPTTRRLAVPLVVGNLLGNVTGDLTGSVRGKIWMEPAVTLNIEEGEGIVPHGELLQDVVYVLDYGYESALFISRSVAEQYVATARYRIKIKSTSAGINVSVYENDTGNLSDASDTMKFYRIGEVDD